jgi:hypothetical protein
LEPVERVTSQKYVFAAALFGPTCAKRKSRPPFKPFHKGVERNGETLVALSNLGETRLGNFSPVILSAKTQRYQKVPAVSAETFNAFVERLGLLAAFSFTRRTFLKDPF